MPRVPVELPDVAYSSIRARGEMVNSIPSESGTNPPAPVKTTRETKCGMSWSGSACGATRWRYDSWHPHVERIPP